MEAYQRDGSWPQRLNRMQRMAHPRPDSGVASLMLNRIGRMRFQALTEQNIAPGPGEDAASLLQGFPFDAHPALPSKGKVKTLTLLVDFADYTRSLFHPGLDEKSAAQNIYGSGVAAAQGFKPYESVHAYYDRASQGTLNIDGAVRFCTLPKNRQEYEPPVDRAGITFDEAGACYRLFLAALQSLGPNFDFAPYSTDHKHLDLVNLLFVGGDSGWGGFWWDYTSFFDDNLAESQGFGPSGQYHVCNYIISRARTRGDGNLDVRVLIHETGHALGLPDLYHYSNSSGILGGDGFLDMMDGGWWGHNAFDRMLLDWISPEVIASGVIQPRTLIASGSVTNRNKALAVFPNLQSTGHPRSEMFIIENRSRYGNDAGDGGDSSFMPGEGLLIWHVRPDPNDAGDNFRFTNTEGDTQFLRLVRNGVENYFNQDESASWQDYFMNGDEFNPTSRPASSNTAGESTGIIVKEISAPGERMTVSVGYAFPRPSGPGASRPLRTRRVRKR